MHKFFECHRYNVGIPALEENNILWRIHGLVFFHGKINVVLLRNTLKGFDVVLRYFHGVRTLILAHELLYGNLPMPVSLLILKMI